MHRTAPPPLAKLIDGAKLEVGSPYASGDCPPPDLRAVHLSG